MKKILVFMIICLVVIGSKVNAAAIPFTGTISANSSRNFLGNQYAGDAYKYALINVTSMTSGSTYRIGLLGNHTTVKVIGTSPNISSTGRKYMLPKSGMSCPGGYCFGIGKIGQTTITSESDCSGDYCSFYGIRIYNVGSNSMTISGTYELFK